MSNISGNTGVGVTGTYGLSGSAIIGYTDQELKEIKRDITISMLEGKYKCISAYKIPDDFYLWSKCPNCNLYPLVWEFNNGKSTACGCGENEYRHFSIHSESIMSYVTRNNGSALGYDSKKLRINWNYWVDTGIELESHEKLKKENRW